MCGHLAITHLSVTDDKLASWHTLCEPLAHALRATPSADTLVSPAEMLTGRPMKRPYAQPVDIAFVRADIIDRKETRRAYVRARAMMKKEQEGNESPLRSYMRTVQTFEKGDFVRMRTDSAAALPLADRTRKWTQ